MMTVAQPHQTLFGKVVNLVPLTVNHAADLLPHALEPVIWQYMPYGNVDTLDKLRAVILDLLVRQAQGTDLCYTVWHLATDQPIGFTRFIAIDRTNESLEIGGTWYGAEFRRTSVNTESKLLLLMFAFDSLGCRRVQIQTDVRNEASQRAIERLGAVREGILRKNKLMPDGYERSSVMYSIINDDWPAIKKRITRLLSPVPNK